ncbi:NAD-dependent succinate-semialdehyde dehydrogenase [Virgibacillus halophilus]|uniref:NAD-dependent succinate-semialdehyde dehydrogenase n=1 Tax=Tigheibacillus halophilus TaxID=361280 RepID=UPI00362D7149
MEFKEFTNSLFINGEWHQVDQKQTESVVNPATLEHITKVSYGGKSETEQAIAAASAAFSDWSKKTGRERSRYLYRAHELMLKDVDRLGEILTMEQGKPLQEAKGEIKSAASFLLWYAEEASRGYGEWLPSSTNSKRMLVIGQPIGVVGAITPWNFPSSMITRKVAPALAAGCTVVLKPSPETPLSAIAIMEIFEKAGLPGGVVNMVTGDAKAIGQAMLNSKAVKMITFTGSTATGKYLMSEGAKQMKKVSLELGGHAPIIVFDDADLEKAATLSLASKFRNNGQTCICANRLYVHEKVAEAFTALLKEKVEQLQIGNGVKEGVDLGPLINEQAVKKVKAQYDDALSKGAQIVCGGSDLNAIPNGLAGFYFQPTVLSEVTDDMAIMTEETFGPLFPIQLFSDDDEAIAKANNTDYGLAAYIFTENTGKTLRTAEKLEYGIVGVNDVFPALSEAPFGGMKESGNSKEGGHHGMDEFLEKKLISIAIE